MEVEGIGADQDGGEFGDGVVDVGGGQEGVAWGRIDVAPPFDAFVRGDVHEDAALDGGCAVHAVNSAGEGHVYEDGRDGGYAHGGGSIPWQRPLTLPSPPVGERVLA